MPNHICITCGVEYPSAEKPPAHCPICQDERQYVNPLGQAWTTLAELQSDHHNLLDELEPGLTQIRTTPGFGIGQRALLIQNPGGNVLWDCISLIDDETIEAVTALGGISALAMSHPHMFGSMVEWSHAFDNAPIYLHSDYEKWVQRPDSVIQFWEGETHELAEGPTLYRTGGHFKGQTILHWLEGASGRGVLLTTDAMYVNPGRQHVAFMYSYPNHIPLSVAAVDRIVEIVMPLKFDRIYSHFHLREIEADAKDAIRRSVERYKLAVGLPN